MLRLQPYIEHFECKTSLNLIQVDNHGDSNQTKSSQGLVISLKKGFAFLMKNYYVIISA
jgi:hypothetical protein